MSSFMKVLIAGMVCSLLFTGSSLLATTLAAKKDGVKVHIGPSKKTEVVTTLKSGQMVEASDRKGMYWKIVVEGKDGFVSFTKVKRQAGKPSALASAIKSATATSRDMDGVKSSRSRSAVMGVRGLDESEETSSAGNVAPNLRMVYQMEDRIVTQKRVAWLGDRVQAEMEQRMRRSEK